MKSFDFEAFVNRLKAIFDKNKRLKTITAFLILCMLAVLLTAFLPETDSHEDRTDSSPSENQSGQLNEQLTELIGTIKGAGRVKVMITYDTSGENVYARDTDEEIEVNGDADSKRIKSEYIIVNSSQGEQGLKVKDVLPTVRGVAVVCDGAGDPYIKGQIISTVSALFDINSTRISVAEMAD